MAGLPLKIKIEIEQNPCIVTTLEAPHRCHCYYWCII